MSEKLYGKLEPLDEAYERGYRAGVEAMKEAAKVVAVAYAGCADVEIDIDDTAARLLKEK